MRQNRCGGLLLGLGVWILATTPLFCQVVVPYHPPLDDGLGIGLPDGEYPAVFSLWSEEVGGQLLWEDRDRTVVISEGRAWAQAVFGPSDDVDAASAWLDVELAGASLGPRIYSAHDFPLGVVVDGRIDATQVQFGDNFNWQARIGAPFQSLSLGIWGGGIVLGTGTQFQGAIGRVLIAESGLVELPGIIGPVDASLANPTSGFLLLGRGSFANLVFDDNEIMARNNGAASTLYLQHEGGAVFVNGAVVHASDLRLKENVRDLEMGLDEVLRLRPVSFSWKDRDTKTQIGLVAQEVGEVVEEILLEDEEGMLGISYSELVPLLIRAIQEQEARIAGLERVLGTRGQCGE